RAHSIRVAAPRPDRTGRLDTEGRGRAALHPPADSPGVAASERGCGLPFVAEISRVIWGGDVEGWHEGSHLADAAARAGLDLDELDPAIAAHPGRHDAVIAQNQQALEAAGHWGVPTMVFADEPFFGQDRIDLLVWRLRQHGLRRRSS